MLVLSKRRKLFSCNFRPFTQFFYAIFFFFLSPPRFQDDTLSALCLKSLNPCYIVSYYMKRVKTSWNIRMTCTAVVFPQPVSPTSKTGSSKLQAAATSTAIRRISKVQAKPKQLYEVIMYVQDVLAHFI